MSDVVITGAPAVHQMLGQWTNPKLDRRLQQATKAGATVFKAPVKAEAAPISRRLARSVSVRRASRDRPATVVTFRPRIAWFRHFLIGGTKDHGPRKAEALVFIPGFNQYSGASSKGVGNHIVRVKKVRGIRANPIIARVAQRLESQAYAAIDRALDEEI